MRLDNYLVLLAFATFISISSAYVQEPKCAHNRHNDVPELLNVEEAYHPTDKRVLQTTLPPNIRIQADYTFLRLGDSAFFTYIRQQLLPPVIDYFTAAIRIIQPLTTTLKLPSTLTSICGFPVPQTLITGALTDFYLIVSSEQDPENWVASAGPCFLSSTTKRPLIAKMLFNIDYTKAANGDVLGHEKNMYLTMHEMLHALGFTGSSMRNFLDANGQPRVNHIRTILVNGNNHTVLNVEPLTTRLRAHFGCSTLEGAFMEDDGGVGTEGSHFERRQFLYEVMTSGVIDGRRISEFSLAVLEGSGWYRPNYTFAEPFHFGRGQGCTFLKGSCTSPTFSFEEFCTGSERACTAVGRGGGVCTIDTRSDNCSYQFPVIDYDCENEGAADSARFPELQAFGRTAGSKCFNANLTKLTKTTPTTFCFKYTCSGSGLTTKLIITVGTTTVTCASANDQPKVAGYNGNIYCPDPISFCNTVGKRYCSKNCMGRGNCVNGVCQCRTGFKGVDCALPSTWV